MVKTALYGKKKLCSIMLLVVLVAPLTAQDRPNIIWLMAEDISNDIETYGMAGVETPNRSAMMVGTHQNRIGAQHHRSNRDRVLPAAHYFSCVEEATLVVGKEETAEQLLQKFPKFESVARRITEKGFGRQRKRMASYISNSPEQRYRTLLEKRPALIQRIPQYMLASYIGVKPESLSRIRRRMLQREGG